MKSSYSSSARSSNAHTSTNADSQRKREEAAIRQAEYSALTIEQKIARASSRRGESRRELARLNAQLKEKAA